MGFIAWKLIIRYHGYWPRHLSLEQTSTFIKSKKKKKKKKNKKDDTEEQYTH